MTITRAQFNPSTLKTIYNPSTQKNLNLDYGSCTKYVFTVEISDVQDCGFGGSCSWDGRDINGVYIVPFWYQNVSQTACYYKSDFEICGSHGDWGVISFYTIVDVDTLYCGPVYVERKGALYGEPFCIRGFKATGSGDLISGQFDNELTEEDCLCSGSPAIVGYGGTMRYCLGNYPGGCP